MTNPSVTILVPTYGRTSFLGESVECFRRQDYDGDMQMWIVNDRRDQHLICDVPGVQVTNLSKRIAPLGRKRRYMVDRVATDLVCFWDDDDIYLPMRIRQGVERMDPQYMASCEYRTWVDDGEPLLQLFPFWTPWGNVMLQPKIFKQIEWNYTLERQERHMLQQLIATRKLRAEDGQHGFPSFIYRRHSNNISSWKKIADPGTIKDRIDAKIESGEEPSGEVVIEPRWDRDYLAWAQESLAAIEGGGNDRQV